MFPRIRDTYKDLETLTDSWLNKNRGMLCLLKYDGIWAQVEINSRPGMLDIYSRTGQLKQSRPLTQEQKDYFGEHLSIFRGEFMYGQQWAQHPDRKGKVYLWECLVDRGKEIRSWANFSHRYDLCHELPGFEVAGCIPHKTAEEIEDHFSSRSFEGVVFVDSYTIGPPTFFRYKPDLEDDVIITGFTRGEGRLSNTLGAVRYSMFKNGISVELGLCGGGFSDELRNKIWNDQASYLYKVITVTSKLRFASGALRSANFKCFRNDKPASECVLKPNE